MFFSTNYSFRKYKSIKNKRVARKLFRINRNKIFDIYNEYGDYITRILNASKVNKTLVKFGNLVMINNLFINKLLIEFEKLGMEPVLKSRRVTYNKAHTVNYISFKIDNNNSAKLPSIYFNEFKKNNINCFDIDLLYSYAGTFNEAKNINKIIHSDGFIKINYLLKLNVNVIDPITYHELNHSYFSELRRKNIDSPFHIDFLRTSNNFQIKNIVEGYNKYLSAEEIYNYLDDIFYYFKALATLQLDSINDFYTYNDLITGLVNKFDSSQRKSLTSSLLIHSRELVIHYRKLLIRNISTNRHRPLEDSFISSSELFNTHIDNLFYYDLSDGYFLGIHDLDNKINDFLLLPNLESERKIISIQIDKLNDLEIIINFYLGKLPTIKKHSEFLQNQYILFSKDIIYFKEVEKNTKEILKNIKQIYTKLNIYRKS